MRQTPGTLAGSVSLNYKSITSEKFFNHVRNAQAGWISHWHASHYSSFKFFYEVFMNPDEIRQLCLYHHALYFDKAIQKREYENIYKPLGISEVEYFKPIYYSLEEIIRRIKVSETIFSSTEWWQAVNVWRSKTINFDKNPITLRELDSPKFEIMDGDHRLIAKVFDEGFTFGCPAFVMSETDH